MSVGEILSRLLSFVYILYVIILTAKILLDNKHPEVTIAWIVTIVFLPYIVIIIYFLGGVDRKKK